MYEKIMKETVNFLERILSLHSKLYESYNRCIFCKKKEEKEKKRIRKQNKRKGNKSRNRL